MKNVTIKVTEKDIENGTRYSPHECAVALAITRATRQVAGVSGGYAWLPRHRKMKLPDEVFLFAKAFDRGDLLSPITFKLCVPK